METLVQKPRPEHTARLLLADDNAEFCAIVRELLTARPEYQIVYQAISGGEAFSRSRELLPDLVLMDLSLPEVNGLEATRRLTQEEPSLPVIVLLPIASAEYQLAALGVGAISSVAKERLDAELLPAIDAALDGRSRRLSSTQAER